MTVEHIVIPAGGPHGIRYLATLLHLRDLGYWVSGDIKSMYGTSVGALMAAVLCLDFDTRDTARLLHSATVAYGIHKGRRIPSGCHTRARR